MQVGKSGPPGKKGQKRITFLGEAGDCFRPEHGSLQVDSFRWRLTSWKVSGSEVSKAKDRESPLFPEKLDASSPCANKCHALRDLLANHPDSDPISSCSGSSFFPSFMPEALVRWHCVSSHKQHRGTIVFSRRKKNGKEKVMSDEGYWFLYKVEGFSTGWRASL